MIARNVKTTSFTDNTANNGVTYYYKIKAVDKSLNRSEYSNVITSATTGEKDLVMHLRFENNLNDNSANGNHGSGYGSCTFTSGNVDDKAVSLSSSKSFIQLPANIANHKEITISAWIYNRTTSSWPRIFDFGNGENEYMFLTTRASSGNLRFGIKNNGDEQYIEGGALSSRKWTHIAVTLGESGARLYVNGEMVSEDASIKITPDDFKPALNYIGRSQFSDPLLNAYIDDFRVYNYELPAEMIQTLSDPLASNITEENITGNVSLWPLPANETLFVNHNLNCEIATKIGKSVV